MTDMDMQMYWANERAKMYEKMREAVSTIDRLNRKWEGVDEWSMVGRSVLVDQLEEQAIHYYDIIEDVDPIVRDAMVEDLGPYIEALKVMLVHRADDYQEVITTMALSMSLCPYHLGDYASCFDDQAPECAMIRLIHPAHDT